jgi:hypothetical protein
MDLVTLQRKDVETTMKSSSSGMIGENMWQNYQHVVGQITIFFEVASRAYFLFNFFRRQENGWQLAIVCALSPVITVLSYMNVIGDGKILSYQLLSLSFKSRISHCEYRLVCVCF